MKSRQRRILAALAAIMLITILIFSYVYLVKNVHHHCTGKDCPICLEIQAVMQTISNIKLLPVLPLIIAVLCVLSHICIVINNSNCTKNTLITLKVELLN